MSPYAEFEDYIPSHATNTYGFPGPFQESSEHYPEARVQVPVPGRSRRTSRPARLRTALRPSPVPRYFCCDDLECYNSSIPVSFENPTSRQFQDAVKDDSLYIPNVSSRSFPVYESDPLDSPNKTWSFSRPYSSSSSQCQPSYDSLRDDPYSHLSNFHRRASLTEILTAHRLAQRGGVLVGDGYGFNSNPYSPYCPYSVDSSRGRDVYGDPWNSYPRCNQCQSSFQDEDDLYNEDKIDDEAGSAFSMGFSELGFNDSL